MVPSASCSSCTSCSNLPGASKQYAESPQAIRSSVAVLGLDVVGKGLGLLVLGVVVVVAVVVVLGTNKVHLVDATALGAALNGAVLGELKTRISS